MRALVSIEEFWRLGSRVPKAELVAGQVIELTPANVHHGLLASTLDGRLREHVVGRGLGFVVVEVGFILSHDPPTVRAPDVAVVLKERMPLPPPARFFPGPPDLAVEILSPDDRPSDVASKIGDYMRAGAQAVWVVDSQTQTFTVRTRDGSVRYGADEVLRGASPLPDFELTLREFFTWPAGV
ncbi:MAG: Uma2 family endonuclease [Armatimonadota bacterium]